MIKIVNELDELVINITSQIGEGFFSEGYTLQNFLADLKTAENKPIRILISSPGGDLITALGIYDILKAQPQQVTTEIYGMAASAATVIAMAGSVRKMGKNASFLIHQASTFLEGNSDDLSSAARELQRFDDKLITIYTTATGKDADFILNLMKENRFLTADEALEMGFITEIISQNVKNQTTMDEKDQKIQELQTQLDEKIAENEALLAKINELQAEIEQLKLEKAGVEPQEEEENPTALLKDVAEKLQNLLTSKQFEPKNVKHFEKQTPKIDAKEAFQLWKSGKITTNEYLNLVKK